MKKALLFDLGLVDYPTVYTLQKILVEKVAANNFCQTVLLLEHLPVYTVGKSGSHTKHPDALHVDRGGSITYHGPGQLVGYPILYLESKRVSHYIRTLEKSLIYLLNTYTIPATIKEGFPGVWVGTEKIASIGVRVKNNVTYHGFALNVTVDLSPFQCISPCGLDVTMTSMQKLLSTPVRMDTVKTDYKKTFESCFHIKLEQGDPAVVTHLTV